MMCLRACGAMNSRIYSCGPEHVSRMEPRRRMRDYVRGLLGPVGRKNGWQLAEYAGHATPDGLQHLLSRSRWDADRLRHDLQNYVADNSAQQTAC